MRLSCLFSLIKIFLTCILTNTSAVNIFREIEGRKYLGVNTNIFICLEESWKNINSMWKIVVPGRQRNVGYRQS